MASSNDLVTVPRSGLPIAHMRSVYLVGDVERRLDKLPPKEHEGLRSTYERMLEKGPERFQVKPSGLPVMDHLYDDLPNFTEVLDDVRRQLALCEDSRDALEITPLLLLGPPGVGKTHFARALSQLLGTGMGFISMSSLTAGWVLSGASSQWKGARPGKVFETLVDGQYANPVMVVDEIDKAGGEHAYDPLGALYGLLEHDTAEIERSADQHVARRTTLCDVAQRRAHVVARLRVDHTEVRLNPLAQILGIVMLVPGDRNGLKRCDMVGKGAEKAHCVLVAEQAADDVERQPTPHRTRQRGS